MKLFDSWQDFCEYMDFKGYFLDMFICLIYWGIVLGGVFLGAHQYYLGNQFFAIALWIFSGLCLIPIPFLVKWFRKKYAKKFHIDDIV